MMLKCELCNADDKPTQDFFDTEDTDRLTLCKSCYEILSRSGSTLISYIEEEGEDLK